MNTLETIRHNLTFMRNTTRDVSLEALLEECELDLIVAHVCDGIRQNGNYRWTASASEALDLYTNDQWRELNITQNERDEMIESVSQYITDINADPDRIE